MKTIWRVNRIWISRKKKTKKKMAGKPTKKEMPTNSTPYNKTINLPITTHNSKEVEADPKEPKTKRPFSRKPCNSKK